MHRSTPSSFAPPWRTWPDAVWPILIAILVLAAFQNGSDAPFLLDDEVSILENESIRKLTPLGRALWPRPDVYTAGRPLLNFSFALNYAFGGASVRGYHIVNILVHGAAALTLFGIVRRTLLLPRLAPRFGRSASPVAFGAALLWGLHPLQTVSVTYISQRAESLMGLCYLATLYCFLRTVERNSALWRTLMLASCCAGMLVKEVMVTAPIVVFLFDATFVAGSFRDAWRRHRALHLGLAATWLVVLALMIASRIHERGIGYSFSYSWHQYLRIECMALLHYLRLAVLPFGLVFDYGEQITIPSAVRVALCSLPLAAGAALTLAGLRRQSATAFLGCWFFLILAPTSSFLPVAGQPIAENRLYLPLAAISVAIATGICHLLERRAYVALIAMAGSLILLTIDRNQDFRSNLTIWADTVSKQPQSARAHCYYGIALLQAGKHDEAIPRFQSAIRIQPSYHQAHTNLAAAFLGRQRTTDAIQHLETALRIKPDDPVARSNFGTALFQAGRKEEALREYQEVLRLRPNSPGARLNLGIVLAHLGRSSEALAVFEALVRDDPKDRAARDNLIQLRAALQPSSSRQAP